MERESRLLNIREFALYAGGIGRNSAFKLAERSGSRIKIGRRVLVDRLKFDVWLDQQSDSIEI